MALVFPVSQVFPHGSPFVAPDRDGRLYVGLPCRTGETTLEGELRCAQAIAVHEATHLFNCAQRSLEETTSALWEWFDEGTAVFVETHLLPDNPCYLKFLGRWADEPHVPLDKRFARYRAAMFVSYMANRLGSDFVSRVWTDSVEAETPVDTISRLLRERSQEFSHRDPDTCDFFASGYCMDSYFVWDGQSNGLAPSVHAIHGERGIEESFELEPGTTATVEGSLDHLSCRYYRFCVSGSIRTLRFRLETPLRQGVPPIKAEVAIVTRDKKRGAVTTLRPETREIIIGKLALAGDVAIPDSGDIDHLVLVVSNCGLRADHDVAEDDHDDRYGYTIRVSAE